MRKESGSKSQYGCECVNNFDKILKRLDDLELKNLIDADSKYLFLSSNQDYFKDSFNKLQEDVDEFSSRAIDAEEIAEANGRVNGWIIEKMEELYPNIFKRKEVI